MYPHEVLELKEQLSRVYKNHSRMIQEWCEKKIKRIALEQELAKEDERYNRLKDYVDNMNKPPPPCLIVDELQQMGDRDQGELLQNMVENHESNPSHAALIEFGENECTIPSSIHVTHFSDF